MRGQSSFGDARLGAALGHLPEPLLPPGLAARMVEQITRLQQDPLREDVMIEVVGVPPTHAQAGYEPTSSPRRSRVDYVLAALCLAAIMARALRNRWQMRMRRSPRASRPAPPAHG